MNAPTVDELMETIRRMATDERDPEKVTKLLRRVLTEYTSKIYEHAEEQAREKAAAVIAATVSMARRTPEIENALSKLRRGTWPR